MLNFVIRSIASRFWLALVLSTACAACGNGSGSNKQHEGGVDVPMGEVNLGSSPNAVAGVVDVHCAGVPPQPTNQSDCVVAVNPDAAPGSSLLYGATMYNSSGDDDACKYHVEWTSPAIAENQDANFTVSASYKGTGNPNPPACAGCPVQGLDTQNMIAEVYLSETHPAPNSDQIITPGAKGTYTLGPVLFDAPGTWTVRFHLFENCSDVEADSPHGHAAFYVEVP